MPNSTELTRAAKLREQKVSSALYLGWDGAQGGGGGWGCDDSGYAGWGHDDDAITVAAAEPSSSGGALLMAATNGRGGGPTYMTGEMHTNMRVLESPLNESCNK